MMIIGQTALIANMAAALLYVEDVSCTSLAIAGDRVETVYNKIAEVQRVAQARVDALMDSIDDGAFMGVMFDAFDMKDALVAKRAHVAKVRKAQRLYREARMSA